MQTDAVILLGRGGYSGLPRKQLDRLAESAKASQRYCLVIHALVDQGDPGLPSALDQCVAVGAERIIVLPIFVPGDSNLQQWLAKVIHRWQTRQPSPALPVILAENLGSHTALDSVLLDALADASAGTDVGQDPPRNWEHDPAGWSVLPEHQFHVLTCRGPRCTAKGAGDCWAKLGKSLAEHGLRGDERVLIAQTGCLYPCNHGPVMVVYPDGVWYGGITPDAIEQIVVEHFANGRVVQDLQIIPGGDT